MHRFATVEYEQKKRKTRRERFLGRIDALVPWEELEARIAPYYPRAGRGRRPCPLGGDAAHPLRAALRQPQ